MSVSKGKYRLSNMAFDFVSLVPAGDDPMARVVIAKSDPNINDPQEGTMGDKIAKDDLDPEVVAYIDSLEDEVDTLSKSVEDKDTEIEGLKTSLAEAEASGTVIKSEEEQHKALLAKADPAVRALIEKQEAEMAEVRKQAEEERNQRLDREFVSKAAALPMINTDAATLGGLLRRISESLSAEDSATVEKMFRAANEQIAKSNLFDTFGTTGVSTTVSKSVEAQAQELRKADPSLTMEQAQAKVYEMNPDLFKQAMTGEDA